MDIGSVDSGNLKRGQGGQATLGLGTGKRIITNDGRCSTQVRHQDPSGSAVPHRREPLLRGLPHRTAKPMPNAQFPMPNAH
ncbi:MAG: hypothetical protein KME31_01945 [Tolypothrix carrinoi HA7290-LM1]|nr:hypothetical protein [Tolypothrix carrinoi HA7290-LM1]